MVEISYRALLREPLVLFLLLGALIFAAYGELGEPQRDEIVVTQELVTALAEEHRLLTGRTAGRQELQTLVQRYVDEEVLVRAAYAMRLDRGDGRIRRRLIDKMNFVIQQEPAEPDATDLQALFDADPARYRRPAQYDLVQLLVDDGELDAPQLSQLRGGRLEPASLGRVSHVYGAVEEEIVAAIGSNNTEWLHSSPASSWHGPFAGPAGTLLVQVAERRPASEYAPEELRRYLQEDWYIMQRGLLRRERLDAMRREYRIRVESEYIPLRLAGF